MSAREHELRRGAAPSSDVESAQQRAASIKEAEARLRRMNKVFLDAADPIRIADLQGYTTDWNHEAERVFGWTAEEMIGRRGKEILTPEWEILADEVRDRCLQGQPMRNYEAQVRCKDGNYIPVLLSGFLLTAESGEPIGLANIMKDIRELRSVTQQLERKNQELKRFAGVIAHDLREPLINVSSICHLLQEYQGRPLDAEADTWLTHLDTIADRMQRLVKSLLDYARLDEASPLELTDCSAVLADVLHNLQFALTEVGAVVTHDPLPRLHADPTQLLQLFQNLISNAVKYRGTDAVRVHVSSERIGEEWIFSVRDNGRGIDPQHLESIFHVFTRAGAADPHGLGLGLAVCEKVVERHKGRIWAQSEPGRGSTFFFTLPAEARQDG